MARDNILSGFHAAEEAIRGQSRNINRIWVSLQGNAPRLKRLMSEARSLKIPVEIVQRQALARMVGNTRHQDIVLEISPYRYHNPESLLEAIREDSLFCILDEIQDVTNLAALTRTAEGAGVDGIFIPDRRSASVTSITHRLSSGALEHLKIARVTNLAQLIEALHERGVRVICADASATKLWYEADYSGSIAVLVGNEFKGVRRLLKEKSDELVRIPMLGKVKSLNVNVAAAILLYEVIRRRL
ncbi:MAG: 23S rRNA (guanosine(2251)-2'-O)-methyltransferase RlmB [Anaerolineae bacterium]|nr:23S rRNA (guanosine(2251)-2'-O)-methyltransferase RlmB [Anaerolineae bacterium]